MRALLIAGVAVVALTGAACGIEALAVHAARRALAGNPQVETTVAAAPGIGTVGVALDRLAVREGDVAAQAGRVVLSTALHAPGTIRAGLPEGAAITLAGRQIALAGTDRLATLDLALLSGLAPRRLSLALEAPLLDGRRALDALQLAARRDGGAGEWAVDFTLAQLSLAALSAGAVPGLADAEGRLHLTLAAGPVLAGARIDRLDARLDNISLRVTGAVAADGAGQARGRLLFDTDDLAGLVQRAAQSGLLAPDAEHFATAVLSNLAEPLAEGRTPLPAELPCEAAPDAGTPPPDPGWQRLVLAFRDGTTCLGAMPLGPAPRLR